MNNNFNFVRSAVREGMGKLFQSAPKQANDLDLYEKLKQNNFSGMVEKWGPVRTLSYIIHMEKQRGKNG